MFKVFGKKFLIIGLVILAGLIFLIIASILVGRQPLPRQTQPFTHSADHSQITGELIYSELEGGFWIIRYGEFNDKFGGKLVLGNDPRLENFKNGDLVKITGKISEEQVSIWQVGTFYTLESIELLK